MIYKLNKNDINTSESYNKNIFFYKNDVIIPYINLEIFDNSFNYSKVKKYDKLDFAYIIFRDVVEIRWNSELRNEINSMSKKFCNFYKEENYLVDYLEVINVFNKETDPYDFEIKYKEKYIYISENVNIKKGASNFWIPIETPNFHPNLSVNEVLNFFSKANVPNEILDFIDIGNDLNLLKEFEW